MNFIWIILSYILGSIPFCHIVTKLSTNKNILEIGWRKTSGSNVFKNVGKWQGVLAGLLDVFKGFLAVWIARELGLSVEVQVISGVVAIIGHNWSCFIKFAGGRGIGTFIGVFLALSPSILGFSLIPFLLVALIWNASIGTIVFLVVALLLSCHFNQIESIGFFVLLSLLPIFIKRLSPISEIRRSKNKLNLIKNRLIFDDDRPYGLRIKRIIEKLTRK